MSSRAISDPVDAASLWVRNPVSDSAAVVRPPAPILALGHGAEKRHRPVA